MAGYELSMQQFATLLTTISRHHLKQMAALVKLTAHARSGVYFNDSTGSEVPLDRVHETFQADFGIQRFVYNLFMHYAHFGS